MKRSVRLYVEDIINSMTLASSFIEGMTFDDFVLDLKTQYAVERAFTILGEAVRHVPESIRIHYPEIPWRNISGMRNVIIHEYPEVILETVWTTVRDRFPRERPLLERVLRELPPDDPLPG